MKVLLKQNGLYWTGGVEYKEKRFVMDADIRKAHEFKSHKDAKDNLLYWHNCGVDASDGDWEFVNRIEYSASDHNEWIDGAVYGSGGWTIVAVTTTDNAAEQELVCDRKKKSKKKKGSSVNATVRTINHICTEALENRFSKARLLNLQYEVNELKDKYSKIEYDFMIEYTQGFLDEIFRKERQKKVWDSLND